MKLFNCLNTFHRSARLFVTFLWTQIRESLRFLFSQQCLNKYTFLMNTPKNVVYSIRIPCVTIHINNNNRKGGWCKWRSINAILRNTFLMVHCVLDCVTRAATSKWFFFDIISQWNRIIHDFPFIDSCTEYILFNVHSLSGFDPWYQGSFWAVKHVSVMHTITPINSE